MEIGEMHLMSKPRLCRNTLMQTGSKDYKPLL